MVAAKILSLFLGSTIISEIILCSVNPMCVQVSPASSLLYTPSPIEGNPEILGSPVPTYIVLLSFGSMAMSPMAEKT